MIDHISIRVRDLKKSAEFYEAALGAIGYRKLGDYGDAVGFGVGELGESGSVWLVQEGKDDPLSKNIHVAFGVADIESVKKFYDAA